MAMITFHIYFNNQTKWRAIIYLVLEEIWVGKCSVLLLPTILGKQHNEIGDSSLNAYLDYLDSKPHAIEINRNMQ